MSPLREEGGDTAAVPGTGEAVIPESQQTSVNPATITVPPEHPQDSMHLANLVDQSHHSKTMQPQNTLPQQYHQVDQRRYHHTDHQNAHPLLGNTHAMTQDVQKLPHPEGDSLSPTNVAQPAVAAPPRPTLGNGSGSGGVFVEPFGGPASQRAFFQSVQQPQQLPLLSPTGMSMHPNHPIYHQHQHQQHPYQQQQMPAYAMVSANAPSNSAPQTPASGTSTPGDSQQPAANLASPMGGSPIDISGGMPPQAGYFAQAPRMLSDRRKYRLVLRQQPDRARICGFGERDRRPVDPPPIVQLLMEDETGNELNWVEDLPFFVVHATLWSVDGTRELTVVKTIRENQLRVLMGSLVASVSTLLDDKQVLGRFFVFPDLTIRTEGLYRLKFSLLNVAPGVLAHQDSPVICSVISDPFRAYTAKKFPGMMESSALMKAFSSQGLKLVIRKETRSVNQRSAGGKADEGAEETESDRARSTVPSPVESPILGMSSSSSSPVTMGVPAEAAAMMYHGGDMKLQHRPVTPLEMTSTSEDPLQTDGRSVDTTTLLSGSSPSFVGGNGGGGD